MHVKSSWGLIVIMAMTAGLGCTQSRQTIRGQSPSTMATASAGMEGQGPIIGSAPGYGQFLHGDHRPGYGNNADGLRAKHAHYDFNIAPGFHDNNFGYEGGYYAGPNGYYTEHDRSYMTGGECQACQSGHACPSEGCPQCGRGCQTMGGALGHSCNGFPTHYQTYQYNWPQNQVYPNTAAPAGMVQYPYYTFRGPTDFFMK